MKGRVLDFNKELRSGIISGEDGVRYGFTDDAVKNGLVMSGDEVDFVIDGQMAKEIYVVNANFSAFAGVSAGGTSGTSGGTHASTQRKVGEFFGGSNAHEAQKAHEALVKGARTKGLISMVCGFLSAIPVAGIMFSLVGLVFFVWAMVDIKNASQSKTLLKRLFYSVGIFFTGGFLLFFPFVTADSPESFEPSVAIFFVALVLFVVAVCFYVNFVRELSFLTCQNFFLLSFWCMVGMAVLMFFLILVGVSSGNMQTPGFTAIAVLYIGSITQVILNFIAWFKLKEIREADEEAKLPWF